MTNKLVDGCLWSVVDDDMVVVLCPEVDVLVRVANIESTLATMDGCS